MTNVLITGMSGLIGGLLKDHLNSLGGYNLSALNRSEVEGVQNFRADISDLEAIKPAFEKRNCLSCMKFRRLREKPAYLLSRTRPESVSC